MPRSRFCVTSAPGIDEHAVLLQRCARLRSRCRRGRRRSPPRAAPKRAASERGDAAGAREQVLLHQDVIGDGDDVELAGRSVEVDDFARRDSLPSLHCVWT